MSISTSIAWNWITFSISLILIGIVLIFLSYAFNQIITTSNTDITTGIVTQQQQGVMSYLTTWWTFVPWAIVIIGFIAAIIGAIENKGSSA